MSELHGNAPGVVDESKHATSRNIRSTGAGGPNSNQLKDPDRPRANDWCSGATQNDYPRGRPGTGQARCPFTPSASVGFALVQALHPREQLLQQILRHAPKFGMVLGMGDDVEFVGR